MQISKHNQNSIAVDSEKGKFYLGNISDPVGNDLVISTSKGITMPGEFEYAEVSISAIEKKASPNNTWDIVLVSLEGVNILYVQNVVDLNKEEEDLISNANIILVTKQSDMAYLGKYVNKLDLKMVIGVGFDSSEKVLDVEAEATQKIKFKPSDLTKDETEIKYYNLI